MSFILAQYFRYNFQLYLKVLFSIGNRKIIGERTWANTQRGRASHGSWVLVNFIFFLWLHLRGSQKNTSQVSTPKTSAVSECMRSQKWEMPVCAALCFFSAPCTVPCTTVTLKLTWRWPRRTRNRKEDECVGRKKSADPSDGKNQGVWL